MKDWRTGPRNAITDVAGLLVGNASDARVGTGVTVLTADRPFVAGVDVRGGAPGTRETDLLAPGATVGAVHALVLSGGSAHGLDAASGVMAGLHARGIGFAVGGHVVPIVPAAILFDLMNGGDKDWGGDPPYRRLGREALDAASSDIAIGTVGAGTGATTADAKGGLGTASTRFEADGRTVTVGALVAVNALGSALHGGGPHFLAAPFERGDEFGGLGAGPGAPGFAVKMRGAADTVANTTIGIVATDAPLDKAGCTRLAAAAHDGFARALWPVHTPLDGDLVFGVSTGGGAKRNEPGMDALIDLSSVAAECMARAIARGIHAARPDPADAPEHRAWADRFGGRGR